MPGTSDIKIDTARFLASKELSLVRRLDKEIQLQSSNGVNKSSAQ